MATTFTTSALPDFVKQNEKELLTAAALSAKSLDFLSIRTNVKHKEALNYLDSAVAFADGSACGFTPAGSDTISQRVIEVKPIKVEKEWCAKALQTTYLNQEMLIEAGRETLPARDKIVKNNLNAIAQKLETLIWNGDNTLGIDGLLKQINTATGVVKKSLAEGATASQVITSTYEAIPDKVFLRGDVRIFVSPTIYRQYIAEQNATCCANRQVLDAGAASIAYMGDSRVTIVPVAGLVGFNGAIAAHSENLVYGTDVEDSDARYDFWFSRDNETFRFRVLFNAGTQIVFPDEIVYTTVANA